MSIYREKTAQTNVLSLFLIKKWREMGLSEVDSDITEILANIMIETNSAVRFKTLKDLEMITRLKKIEMK